jgi:hypothetical protein
MWLVPGFDVKGKIYQVYKRIHKIEKGEWVWRLLPTPGIWSDGKGHGLHLPALDFDPERPNIVVCEGPWDGMVLWETWDKGDGHNTNIIAIPGCTTWRDEWTELCRGKCVMLMYDSDHPRQFTPGGRESRAGYDGMVRIAKRLSGIAQSVRWLCWGSDGYDPEKKSGWDVRDELTSVATLTERKAALQQLMGKVKDAPREWFNPAVSVNGQFGRAVIEAIACSSWSTCISAWEEAVKMRQDLRDAIAVLLAICASTSQSGNQLFLDLIGSPGSMKTTMCKGLLTSTNCVHLENVTKLISGWFDPNDKKKDFSFLARSNNKTWVTCEFDVLGSSSEYHQLMGKVRRIFDGETSATYANRDHDTIYTGLRTPWIRAGTHRMMDKMADYDQSQLGDRFLRYIISEPSEEDRREIARSAIRAEREAMMGRVNGTAGSLVNPKTARAQGLTGGYVDWLRDNAESELNQLFVSEEVEDFCIDLALLCADLRARPNEGRRVIDAHNSRELPTRLGCQYIRLAKCLAVVFNQAVVTPDVLRIVRKVAIDTAYGHSLNIAGWLCAPNPQTPGKNYQESGGVMSGLLGVWTGMDSARLGKYLNFLQGIKVIELSEKTRNAWLLTERVYRLYLRVMRGSG